MNVAKITALVFWAAMAPWSMTCLVALSDTSTVFEAGEMVGGWAAITFMMGFSAAVLWSLGGIQNQLGRQANAH